MNKTNLLKTCILYLEREIAIINGDYLDISGIGNWRMFCDCLESATDCKVITKEQWDDYVNNPK